jgi:hypothetical protein
VLYVAEQQFLEQQAFEDSLLHESISDFDVRCTGLRTASAMGTHAMQAAAGAMDCS